MRSEGRIELWTQGEGNLSLSTGLTGCGKVRKLAVYVYSFCLLRLITQGFNQQLSIRRICN